MPAAWKLHFATKKQIYKNQKQQHQRVIIITIITNNKDVNDPIAMTTHLLCIMAVGLTENVIVVVVTVTVAVVAMRCDNRQSS